MWRKRALSGAVVLALALSLFAAPALQAADRAPERGPAGLWASIEHWIQQVVLDPLGWFSDQPADSGLQTQTKAATCDPATDPTCSGAASTATTTDEGGVVDPDGT